MELGKTETKIFESFKQRAEERMLAMENGFDKVIDKNNNLENWIDIYLPLRL